MNSFAMMRPVTSSGAAKGSDERAAHRVAIRRASGPSGPSRSAGSGRHATARIFRIVLVAELSLPFGLVLAIAGVLLQAQWSRIESAIRNSNWPGRPAVQAKSVNTRRSIQVAWQLPMPAVRYGQRVGCLARGEVTLVGHTKRRTMDRSYMIIIGGP